LNRIKHSTFLPRRALRWILEQAGVRVSDIEIFAVTRAEPELDQQAGNARFSQAGAPHHWSGRAMLADLLQRELGVDPGDRLRFCGHHLAHAWSAFYPSGFDEALVITID